eukprot:gb/GEZN01012105.1/.p1 GENE.gb/GEZN01012105.1/~~gb/GEZN01012105.1/.p1  ORF type:complete len:309 (-),score=43.23 gb/GEZN01012105.1/:140-1066(-)
MLAMSGVDRLLDFVGSASPHGDTEEMKASDLENVVVIRGMAPDIEAHFKLYDPINAGLAQINDSVQQINQLKQKDRVAAKERERHEILTELDDIMSKTTAVGRKMKKCFDEIKLKDDVFAKEHSNQTAKVDIRRNTYQLKTRNFHDTMTKYHQGAEEFKTALKDRTKRELSIVDTSLTEADLDKIVENGTASDVVKQALNSDNLTEAVREIEQRSDDIKKLEKSVLEVFELFRDLATLVDLQQEAFDHIEHNISHAAQHVAKTEGILRDAEKHQKTARSRRCMFLGILLVVLVVILAPVLNSVFKKTA